MNANNHPHFSDSDFVRSSSCTYPPGGCIEVAMKGGAVALRDTQKPGQVLLFSTADWKAFVEGVKKGEFDAT